MLIKFIRIWNAHFIVKNYTIWKFLNSNYILDIMFFHLCWYMYLKVSHDYTTLYYKEVMCVFSYNIFDFQA